MPKSAQTISRRVRLSQPAILTAIALTGLALVAWHATASPKVDDAVTVQTQVSISPIKLQRVSTSRPELPAVSR